MKITPETLKALTKRLALENKNVAKRFSKKETDDINVIDALKELEQYMIDDEIIDSNEDDQDEDDFEKDNNKDDTVDDSDDESEEDSKDDEDESDEGDEGDDVDKTKSVPIVDYDLEGLKTVDIDSDATIELSTDNSEEDAELELVDEPEDEDEIEIEDDIEELDESALGDLITHFGEGIKGILKLCGKGLLVVIAGLGGSFLFGLPGLLIAVMIAFGLLTGDKVTNENTIRVNEGIIDSVKNKIKTVCKILKADPKKAEEINAKVLAAKKSGDSKAIQAAADEVRALVGDDKDKKVTEKHGDKNNRGWRKNRKSVRESDDTFKDFEDVEIGDRGEDYNGIEGIVVAKGTIRELADEDPRNSDIEELLELGFDENDPAVLVKLDGGHEEIIYIYDDSGFVVYDTDSIEVSEDGDLASKLDALDADELKKLKPDQKEKLQELFTEKEHSDDIVIPSPYDRYFTFVDPEEADNEYDDYKVGDTVEGMKLIADLEAANSSRVFLTDDEECPIVEIVAGRVYPYTEEDLVDLTPVDSIEVSEDGDEVTSTQQIVEFLKESRVIQSNAAMKHAARRYLKMTTESPMKAQLIAKRLNKKFGNNPVKESHFCETFTKIVL